MSSYLNIYGIPKEAYVCKLLAQKSYTNEDAIKLFHDKMKEICND